MSRLQELIDELCPGGVEYRHFDDVCTLKARVGWQRLTKKEHLPSGDYMLVTGTDFTEAHRVNYETCVYVDEARYAMDENIQLKNGDVLITKDGTLGKVAYVDNLPKPATLNGGVFVVRSKDGRLEQKFILYFLLSYWFMSAVESQHTGSTIKHLTQAIFSRILIPVPPIEVQREVVRILDSFQELDDALTAEIEAREKQFDTYRNRLLFEEPSRDAVTMPFKECCKSMNTGPFGSSVHKSDYTDDGCPIVNPADIVGTDIVIGKRVSPEAEDRLTRYKLEVDDIVIGRRGEMGRIAVVDENSAGFLCGTGCFFVRMNDKGLPGYWRYLFGTDYAKVYLDANAVGSTMKNLNLEILGGMPVPVPPVDRQREIVDTLDAMTDLINSLGDERDARRKQCEHYRDRLLMFPEKEVVTNG